MSELRRDAIIEIMTECKKDLLKNYLRSYELPTSGTKLELATRIYDNSYIHTLQAMLPPSGTVSIGISLEPEEPQ
jgi:hypothetical protein